MALSTIDIVVLLAVGLFGVVGAFTGFIKQAYSLIALVIAYILARPVGSIFAEFISARSETPPGAAFVIGSFAAGLGIFAAVKVFFSIVHHFLGKKGQSMRGLDRLLGGLFASAKVFAVCWLLLCFVAAMPDFFKQHKPDVHAMLQESVMGRLIERWNPVETSRFSGGVRGLASSLRDPQKLEELQKEPSVAELMTVLKKKAENDERFRRALQSGDVSSLMEILEDPEIREAYGKIDFNAVLDRAAKMAEE